MKTNLESTLTDRYGVGILHASPTTVIWAADHLAGIVGYPEAARQLKRLNAKRRSAGVISAYPEFGTKLFKEI